MERAESKNRRGDAAGAMKRLIRPLMAFVAVIFLVHAGLDLYERWDGRAVPVHLSFVALACLLAAVAMIFQFLAWRSLVHQWSEQRMPFWSSGRLYLDSQMARYTPGKVGLPAVRILGAPALGVSSQVMGATLLVELLSWCSVGSITGGVLLISLSEEQGVFEQLSQGGLLFVLGAALTLGAAMIIPQERIPGRVRALFASTQKGPLVPLRLVFWHFLHFGTWVLCGAMLCRAVGGSWAFAAVAGAVLCVAIVAGFLALLAPAGAGVREAVILVGLTPFLGSSAALALGLLARIASLLSDVILWVVFRLKSRSRESSNSGAAFLR